MTEPPEDGTDFWIDENGLPRMRATIPELPLPWHYAALAGRSYITPEDITAAHAAALTGEEQTCILIEVLRAIADRQCEDVVTSAFVACRFEKKTP